uniref:DUF4939 domain-containing protein n=1 Tax=Fundulus heteroclitus TaxID=8078 RepID=A0A3Q2TF56_FUNHE
MLCFFNLQSTNLLNNRSIHHLQLIRGRVAGVAASIGRPRHPSSSRGMVSTPTPEPFFGELNKSRGFLLQCSLVFNWSPQLFPDVAGRISYIVGLLRGRALSWAELFIDETSILSLNYSDFLAQFKRTFTFSLCEEEAAKRL